jgi:hypothetical protein
MEKSNVKQSEKVKSLNISNLKKSFQDESVKKNFTKEVPKGENFSLYKDEFNSKRERQKIRNKLDRFVSDILGKDRKDEERIESLKSFLEFYRKCWKIVDFKIENFSHSRSDEKKKDYQIILEMLKNSLA